MHVDDQPTTHIRPVRIEHLSHLCWNDLPRVEDPLFARYAIERENLEAILNHSARISGLTSVLRDMYQPWQWPLCNDDQDEAMRRLLQKVADGEYVVIDYEPGYPRPGALLWWSVPASADPPVPDTLRSARPREGRWIANPRLHPWMRSAIEVCLKRARRGDSCAQSQPEYLWWNELLQNRRWNGRVLREQPGPTGGSGGVVVSDGASVATAAGSRTGNATKTGSSAPAFR